MEPEIKLNAGQQHCVKCGKRTTKQRGGIWQCFSCHSGLTEASRCYRDEQVGEFLEDGRKEEPIGVWDGFRALEAKLKAIDEELKAKLNDTAKTI